MKSTELDARAEQMFGTGWKSAFAQAFNLNYATVKRWVTKSSGRTPVPPWVPPVLDLMERSPKDAWPGPLRARAERRRRQAAAASPASSSGASAAG